LQLFLRLLPLFQGIIPREANKDKANLTMILALLRVMKAKDISVLIGGIEEAGVIMIVVVVVAEVVVAHSKIPTQATITTDIAMTAAANVISKILTPRTPTRLVQEGAEVVEEACKVLNRANSPHLALIKPSITTKTTVSTSSSNRHTERVVRTKVFFTEESI